MVSWEQDAGRQHEITLIHTVTYQMWLAGPLVALMIIAHFCWRKCKKTFWKIYSHLSTAQSTTLQGYWLWLWFSIRPQKEIVAGNQYNNCTWKDVMVMGFIPRASSTEQSLHDGFLRAWYWTPAWNCPHSCRGLRNVNTNGFHDHWCISVGRKWKFKIKKMSNKISVKKHSQECLPNLCHI